MFACSKLPRLVCYSVFAVVGGAGLLSPVRAQFIQQGTKLVGTGAVGGPLQGSSVALSADGNTALVGALDDNDFTGAAWVYTRSGGVWSQQGGKLVGTGAVKGPYQVYQGCSVALSADGNTAIVGGSGDNGGAGAVWVYTRSGGIWSQQGAKLVGTGAVDATGGYVVYQGASVALSADGNTAIVGAPGDNGNIGAVWVYTRSGAVWSQQGAKLVGTSASIQPGYGPQQGASVALSADGNTAVVGGPWDAQTVGAVWVYTRSGGVWSQQGDKLVGTGIPHSILQGSSVALSGDGNTAIVGGPGANQNSGAVWVFTRSGGVWSQQGGALVGTGAQGAAAQGSSVSLSGDGNTAIVGGPGDAQSVQFGSTGAVWVYTRSGGVWSQQGGKLVGTGTSIPPSSGPQQGVSVALSADGSAAIVGGPIDNGDVGAAWVFVLSATSSGPFISSGGVVNGAIYQRSWTVSASP
jgi:hypothetical protein